MNCINHIDRPAVAACSSCGVFLCRECASKHKPVLCDDCFGEISRANRKQRQIEAKEAYNEGRRLVISGVVFVILAVILGIAFSFSDVGAGQGILVANGIAFFRYGWRGWQSIKSKLNFSLAMGPFAWFVAFVLGFAIIFAFSFVFYIKDFMRFLKGRR